MEVAMRQLTVQEVINLKIRDLGLDPTKYDLLSVEVLAAILRRNASYTCPTTPSQLISSAVNPLRGLGCDIEELREVVERTLQAMIAYGDLIESKEFAGLEENGRMLLYAAPSNFILRDNGNFMLSGIVSSNFSPLPPEIAQRIECIEHLRMIRPSTDSDLKTHLLELGFSELTMKKWLRTPKQTNPTQLVAKINDFLIKSTSSPEIPGLEILDSTKPVTYYKGRWVKPTNLTGEYVARRDQAWGSKLWSYVQINNGKAEHIIDFPVEYCEWNAWDEAWYLQMAIDASYGNPQLFRIEQITDNKAEIKLFSPIPTWAQRRLDIMGEPKKLPGCLIGYIAEISDIAEITNFLKEYLWLSEQN